jgi:hypothetical protein
LLQQDGFEKAWLRYSDAAYEVVEGVYIESNHINRRATRSQDMAIHERKPSGSYILITI